MKSINNKYGKIEIKNLSRQLRITQGRDIVLIDKELVTKVAAAMLTEMNKDS